MNTSTAIIVAAIVGLVGVVLAMIGCVGALMIYLRWKISGPRFKPEKP